MKNATAASALHHKHDCLRIHGSIPFGGAKRGFSSQVNYHWTLRDVQPGDGGFCLIPASSKMATPIPRPPTTSIDLPAVKHLASPAGSIVFCQSLRVFAPPAPLPTG